MRKIREIAVIGSGIMGGGIAALFAGAGIKALLLDVVPPGLTDDEKMRAEARNGVVKKGLDMAIRSKPPVFMTPQDAARITLGNLEDDFDKLSSCDWIIEVVVENLKIKKDLFKRIEAVRKKGSIVSSNTSGIPLKAMSGELTDEFQKNFLGTHFFNPVRYMKLLEIIPGEKTDPQVTNFVADFGERVLGKGIVWAKDTPNFVGNRIGVQGIMMVMNLMVKDGLTIPEVDILFGVVLGRPKTGMFKLSDLVGIDTLGHIAVNTRQLLADDEERGTFVLPEFVEKMIEKGLLGKKTKKGFYQTIFNSDGTKTRKVIDPKTFQYAEYDRPGFPCLAEAKKAKTLPDRMKAVLYGTDKGAQYAWKVTAAGFIYAADRIPEIADTIVEIDNAMKWGFNFELGPFEQWDAIGLERSTQKMEQDGFRVPEKIKEMIQAGHTSFYKSDKGQVYFYDFADKDYKPVQKSAHIISLVSLKSSGQTITENRSASLIDLGDGVFCCEFHTKMNAINAEIVESLHQALDYVDKNGIGLVIGNQAGGMPGAFSAGADLFYMAGLAKAEKFSEIESFLKMAQNGIQKAKYAPFPVVAAPFGLTLGGGCEMCLCADKIVAHADLFMGFVEVGVGLIPGAGGCLNLWKKSMEAIPESFTDIDLAKFFIPVFMAIATAKVSTSAADARVNGFLTQKDRIIFNRDYLIGEAKKDVQKMVAENYAPPIKKKIRVLGQAAQGIVNTEIFNMLSGKFISEYDAILARRIAYVISGGDVRDNSEVDEDLLLDLEREAFVDFWKEPKTHARVEHMLKTGKPLRN